MIQEPSPRDPLRSQFYKMLGPFNRDTDMSSNRWSKFNDAIDVLIPVYDLDVLVKRVRQAWRLCGDYGHGGCYTNRSLAAFREHLSAGPTEPPALHEGGHRVEA